MLKKSIGTTWFHLATKIWGGSAMNKWEYVARQVPWGVFKKEFPDL
jgi:hypothetical protein